MTRKETLSSRKIYDGIVMGTRATIFAWFLSLLVGCALPSASAPAVSRAQEVVVQPFSNNRGNTDLRTAPWLNRILPATQQRESQAQATDQQPAHFGLAESQPMIQLAGYQQDAGTRVYGTPTPPTAPASESYYPGHEDWGYANGSMLPRRGPVYPPPTRQMSPGHFQNQSNHGQPVRRSIEYGGGANQRSNPSRRHPADVQRGHGIREPSSQTFNPHDEAYEFSKHFLIQSNSENEPSLPGSAVGGRARGHFSQGPALQGNSLNPAIRTATEIAIELKIENGRLNEAFLRTQKELDNKKQELAAARAESNRKDRELAKASHLEESLREKIGNLTARLQIAEHQKSELRRQADATLKEIESTLDEALFHNFSKRDD